MQEKQQKSSMGLKTRLKHAPIIGTLALRAINQFRFYRRWLRKYRFYLKHRKDIAPTASLRGKFAGRRAFIVATGPSIKTQDLKLLAGEFCISVSNFFVHPDFKIVKPEYHVFAESHTPITEEQWRSWMEDAEKHFEPGQKVLTAIGDKSIVDRFDLFKKQNVYYYALSESNAPIKTVDFARRIPAIQTVAHQALYLALYSGAKEIYLVGCDHDTILHLGESRHFYKEDANMLAKKGVSEWHHPDWLMHFRAYVHLWEIYQRIADYAKRNGVKIYNATPGSLLDIFPRVELKDILAETSSSSKKDKPVV